MIAEGVQRARDRGHVGGRPRSLDADKVRKAAAMIETDEWSIQEVADQFKVDRSTLYRALTKHAAATQKDAQRC